MARTTFVTTYSYHHGYFDGVEREFRGFGRVEQVDVESFGTFAAANASSPYVTDDRPSTSRRSRRSPGFTPARARPRANPHAVRRRVLPRFRSRLPSAPAIDAIFQEKRLPEPDLDAEDLTADEWREALRACKGMTLRQEVYELDVDALEAHRERTCRSGCSRRPRTTATSAACSRSGRQRHAVFLVTESEALTYHYELDLRHAPAPAALAPDPRIAHTLNLSFDELGNVLQSVAVGYPRVRQLADPALDGTQLALIRDVQGELHVAYTETHVYRRRPARPVAAGAAADDYRLRVPCEVRRFELTGFTPAADGRYFDLDDFLRDLPAERRYHSGTGNDVPFASQAVPRAPAERAPTKRLVEHASARCSSTTT